MFDFALNKETPIEKGFAASASGLLLPWLPAHKAEAAEQEI